MAHINNDIYTTNEDAILGGEFPDIKGFDKALADEVGNATSIMILGGYFSKDYLVKLIRNNVPKNNIRNVEIKIAVGIDPGQSLAGQWNSLRELYDSLQEIYKKSNNIMVRAIQAKNHFHGKLYYFLRTTRPRWYVGSANPTGSNRHELMVRIDGNDHALKTYADAVWTMSRDVKENPGDQIGSLSRLFSEGYLVYHPQRPSLFTFDAFHFEPDERASIDARGERQSRLPYADVKTEGYGFLLAEALGHSVGNADRDESKSAKRVQFKPLAIETVFGYWMPREYKKLIWENVRKNESRKAKSVRYIVEKLSRSTENDRVMKAFREYFKEMNEFARECGVEERAWDDCLKKFEEFLERRSRLADDDKRIDRYCRALVFTEMPDFSRDEHAANNFQVSFFEDVAARASDPRTRRKNRIISCISGQVKYERFPSEPDEWKFALVARLEEGKTWQWT